MEANHEDFRDQEPVSRKSRNFSGAFRVTIFFRSSKWRRLEARNFAVILIVIPFTTYEKTSFTELAARSFTNGFRDFRETDPRAQLLKARLS